MTAYHMQQCVEKSIKYIIEQKGMRYRKTHNILELQKQVKDPNIDKILGPYGVVSSSWEEDTKYAGNTLPLNFDITIFLNITKKILDYATTFNAVQQTDLFSEMTNHIINLP